MKFITVTKDYFDLIQDPELLQKGNNRPHVLVLSLKYKGKNYSFAVPLRSNIPPAESQKHYYSLPPRPTTKPNHRHGLHYVKMFPITKQYQGKFWTGNNPSYVLYQKIISGNIKQIVKQCQDYLYKYENGERLPFSVDIDAAINKLFK